MRPRLCLLVALLAACGDDDGAPGADAATVDAGAADAEPGADYVFDEAQVRTYELTVAAADWQWLQDNAVAEQYVPADLSFEGRTIATIGVRYKGGYGTLQLCFDAQGQRVCPKLSMKLKFDEYVPEQRFHGLKRLNFHAMMYDDSHMKDRLGYGLFRAAGVPAPRATSARLVVNGELLGLFALVEEIDGRFTDDRFGALDGGDGNLYKEIWPSYATAQPYIDALQTNEELADVARMLRFANQLTAAGDAGFRALIEQWMDVPTLANFLAVDRLIDNWDGIVGWYCPNFGPCFNHNYFWYEETGADRMWLLPWDMDNTFQSPNPIRTTYGMPDWDVVPADCGFITVFLNIPGRAPGCDPIIRNLAADFAVEYQAATATLLAGAAAPGVLEAQIDVMTAQLQPFVAEDQFGPGLDAWQQAVAELRAEIAALRTRVAP